MNKIRKCFHKATQWLKPIAVSAALALLALGGPPPLDAADLQSPGSTQYALSNTFLLGGTAYTNVPAAARYPLLSVTAGRGMSFAPIYKGSATCTTGQIGCAFQVLTKSTAAYGDLWNTESNRYIWITFTPNGATDQVGWTNVPATALDNVTALRLAQITNNNAATNIAAWLSNVVAFTSN